MVHSSVSGVTSLQTRPCHIRNKLISINGVAVHNMARSKRPSTPGTTPFLYSTEQGTPNIGCHTYTYFNQQFTALWIFIRLHSQKLFKKADASSDSESNRSKCTSVLTRTYCNRTCAIEPPDLRKTHATLVHTATSFTVACIHIWAQQSS